MTDSKTVCMICSTEVDYYGISDAHHKVGDRYICDECGRRYCDDLQKMSTTIRIKNELLEQFSRLSPREFYRYEAYAVVGDNDTVTFDDSEIHRSSTTMDFMSGRPTVRVLIPKDLPATNAKDAVISTLLKIAEWMEAEFPFEDIPF